MKVSIVMAAYNAEEYLIETIESILAQTYPDLEIIIVNDGSTDSTMDILNRISDKRVKIIHLDANKGVANALNIAISEAKGELIAIHDADDISMPYRIEEQVAYLKANQHVVAVGSFIECIAGKNVSALQISHMKNLQKYKNSITNWTQIKPELFKGCPLTHGSLLMSKDACLKAGKYDTRYKIASDHEFFMRLGNVGSIENIPKILYRYRVSSNSLSNSNIEQTANEFLLVAAKYLRNYYFPQKKDKLSVIVCGTKKACEAFKELMTIEHSLNIIDTVSNE